MKPADRQWVSVFALLALVIAAVIIDRTWFASDDELELGRQTTPSTPLSDAGAGVRRHPRSSQAVQRALELMVEHDSAALYVKRSGDVMSGQLGINVAAAGVGLAVGPSSTLTKRTTISDRSILIGGGRSDITTGLGVGNCGNLSCLPNQLTLSNPATGISIVGVTTWTSNASLVASQNSVADFKATGNGWLELAGGANATVTAFTPTAGTGGFEYDTTNTKLLGYENGAWKFLTTSSAATVKVPVNFGYFSTNGILGTGTDFQGYWNFAHDFVASGPTISTTVNITCDADTAGVGGATGVVMKLVTGSGNCTCNLGTCASVAPSAHKTCNCTTSGTVTDMAVQFNATTDCGTRPSNMRCNVYGFATF